MKNLMIILWVSFCFFLKSNSAEAYLVLSYKGQNVKSDFPTRILVTGIGKEQGTQFQEVASGKALKYSELYPGEQIILIAKNENRKHSAQTTLKDWGFKLLYENTETFDGEALVKEISRFTRIKSIDIFAHGTALYGVYLENTMKRLSRSTLNLRDLQGHFTIDAYTILHGCNTGFFLAPYLSDVWNIPVAGSLTSTDFQRLHSDGSFYLPENGYFPNQKWAKSNRTSFSKALSCTKGACLRLKPDNHPYYGYWGSYEGGGLPFYKFFCVNNSEESCQKVMAKSLFSFVGTHNLKLGASLEEYKSLLGDFLCPISGFHNYRKLCRDQLELSFFTSGLSFNPFRGPMLECDFKSCSTLFKCKRMKNSTIVDGKSCNTLNPGQSGNETLINEFNAYLAGFNRL